MDEQEILDKLKAILVDKGYTDPLVEKKDAQDGYEWPEDWREIDLGERIGEKNKRFGLDSLDRIELIMALEDKFFNEEDVIKEEEVKEIFTVGELVEYIKKKLKEVL